MAQLPPPPNSSPVITYHCDVNSDTVLASKSSSDWTEVISMSHLFRASGSTIRSGLGSRSSFATSSIFLRSNSSASASSPSVSSPNQSLATEHVSFQSATASTAAPAAHSSLQSTTDDGEFASSSSSTSEFELPPGVTPVKYSYFVPRVGKLSDSFPVYTDIRNGGTRCITELRKVQGNIRDLRDDLKVYLEETYSSSSNEFAEATINKRPLIPKPGRKLQPTSNPSQANPIQIVSNPRSQSGKLKIRGNRVQHVKQFLESRGF